MNDEKWMNDLASQLKWPNPSDDLSQKIMNALPKTPAKKEGWMELCARFSFSHPEMAFALTLIMGIGVGMLTLPQATQNTHRSLYSDSDIMFVEAVIENERGYFYD